MSTDVNEWFKPPLTQDRTIGPAKRWAEAAIVPLIAVGFVLFVVVATYLNSPVDPADPPNLGAMIIPAL